MTEVTTTGSSLELFEKVTYEKMSKDSDIKGGGAEAVSARSAELNRNLERATQLAMETLKELSQRRD